MEQKERLIEMENWIKVDVRKRKEIYELGEEFGGRSLDGEWVSFTNYYMEKNGEAFLGVSGEIHFSRCREEDWEDLILKMKMGGVNIVSTYLFWIHHEEVEGEFDFSGKRNLRKFVELCGKHGMYVIIRIGPFDHGEVRNGGLPDWLYGKEYEVRSLNEGFLDQVRIWYEKIGEQVKGLSYLEGGAVIGAQIDNEYEHSAAPWEQTTGVSNEWITSGTEGDAYIIRLKEIAKECGIVVPFYTGTAWGGAACPEQEVLPLWGGYAFWPWIFYSHKGEHPATPEYIYRDYHNNQITKTYNYEPKYLPESMPYACCEMGGGMMCSYQYRFQLPYESIDAMANVKLASGCNLLGYYMYCGGTNPKGKRTEYLNEGQICKLSYDFQAAVGEFGQIRPSYRRLKAIHSFTAHFGEQLCQMRTVLPEHAEEIDPKDTAALRYAIRHDGDSGFLFLNNYQDHVETEAKANQTIGIDLDWSEGDCGERSGDCGTSKRKDSIVIQDLSLGAGENAILPFRFRMEGVVLEYASAQLLSRMETQDVVYYFYFMPEGMKPRFVYQKSDQYVIPGREEGDYLVVEPEADRMSVHLIEEGAWSKGDLHKSGQSKRIAVVVLTREESLAFYQFTYRNKEYAVLSKDALLVDEEKGIRIQAEKSNGDLKCTFAAFPKMDIENAEIQNIDMQNADNQNADNQNTDNQYTDNQIIDNQNAGNGNSYKIKDGTANHRIQTTGVFKDCGIPLFTEYRMSDGQSGVDRCAEEAGSSTAASGLEDSCQLLMHQVAIRQTGPTRYVLEFPDDLFEEKAGVRIKDVLLILHYQGDIGHAFLNGEMIADHFCNGAAWEIGLNQWKNRLKEGMVIYITPLKKDSYVNVESTMAGRAEEVSEAVGILERAELCPVCEWQIQLA